MATDVYALFRRPRATALPKALPGWRPLDLAAFVLVLFAGVTALFTPTDPDVWWHLATGRHVATAGLPPADLFSHTAAGQPWLVQAWLTEVAMANAQAWGGYGVLSVAAGVLQAAAALIIYLLIRQQGAGRRVALMGVGLYMVLAAPTWGVRPQVLTPVFLGAFVGLLEGYRRPPIRPWVLLALPVLMVAWANMHASFFVGLSAVAAYAIGEMASRAFGRAEAAPSGPLWLALAGSAGATLLTPYGLMLWSYPAAYVCSGTASPLLAYTQEWQPLNFHQPGMLVLAAVVVAAALAAQRRPERHVDVTAALMAFGFSVLAVQAVRLLPLVGVAVLPFIAGGLARAYPALSGAREDAEVRPVGLAGWAVTGLAAVGLLWASVSAPDAQLGRTPRSDGQRPYPEAAARYLSAQPGPLRLFNEFEWGGYMIANTPRHLVFIDGRADMYRERVFDDYMAITGVAPGWRERLDRYGVTTVLVRPDAALAYALSREAGWRRTFEDPLAVVYRRQP